MQVIRGTRAPFLAAACALLMIGAGSADAVEPPSVNFTFRFVPISGGPDGCPTPAGSTFDPRELCATDLGAGWYTIGTVFVQLCPPAPTVTGGVLATSNMDVAERIHAEPDPASAVADVRARVTCALDPRFSFIGVSRELPAVAVSGTAAEAQVITDLSGGGVEVSTIVAIGSSVLAVGVADDVGPPDNAVVLRIVNSAIDRYRNPRPFGGPFAPVVGRAPVLSPAP